MGRRRAAAGGRTKKRVEVLEKEGGFGGFYLFRRFNFMPILYLINQFY